MTGKSIRNLSAVLTLAAVIGLCQPGLAQQNDGEDKTPTLESLLQELKAALAALRSLEERVGALQAFADEEGRKTLVPRIPTGLSRSTETPVFSTEEGERLDSETDPGLAQLLPDSDVRFPALSSTLGLNYRDSRVSLSDNAHVRAISSDGQGGFHVTYVISGQERTVHFESSEYRSSFRNYGNSDGSRITDVLWSYTNSFTRRGTDRNRGSTEFRYFDGHGSVVPGHRIYMSYGARTEPGGFSVPSATYAGRMSGNTYSRNAPDSANRTLVAGALSLTADFEDGTIEGRIDRIRTRPAGNTNYAGLPFSTRFDIGRGHIVDGQFTATLTGVDTDADAATDRTVAGYTGSILGEFYGPAAEEVGGVLNAESDAHNSVIAGWFGGRQLRSVVPAGKSSDPSSVGIERDYEASTVQVADDSAVTAISSDGAGGYNVTYSIDGVEYAVQLEGSDHGSYGPIPTLYNERTGTESRTLYSSRTVFHGATSFFGDSEYDHFDVLGWAFARYDNADSGTPTYSPRGFLVHGVRTEADSLPAGEASYAGEMGGYIWEADDPESANRTLVTGALSLTADFGDSTVSGTINGMKTGADRSSLESSTEVLAIGAGTITDSTFAATLTGTGGASSRYEGDVDGQFFGPDAREVGGVLQATHTGNDRILIGWIAGKRDDLAEVAASQ